MSDTPADTRERTPLDDAEAELARILERLRSLAPGEPRDDGPQLPDAALDFRNRGVPLAFFDVLAEAGKVGSGERPKFKAEEIAVLWARLAPGEARPEPEWPSDVIEKALRYAASGYSSGDFIGQTVEAKRMAAILNDLADRKDWRREPPQQNDGWRPIESAPKGGADFRDPSPHILVVDAGAVHNEFEDARQAVVAHWYKSDWYDWHNYKVGFKPTHWQPLPPAPREQSGEEKT